MRKNNPNVLLLSTYFCCIQIEEEEEKEKGLITRISVLKTFLDPTTRISEPNTVSKEDTDKPHCWTSISAALDPKCFMQLTT